MDLCFIAIIILIFCIFLSIAIHCELFMRCVPIYEVVLISIRAQYNTLAASSALLIM